MVFFTTWSLLLIECNTQVIAVNTLLTGSKRVYISHRTTDVDIGCLRTLCDVMCVVLLAVP